MWGISSPPGLLPPRPSRQEKLVWKWMKEHWKGCLLRGNLERIAFIICKVFVRCGKFLFIGWLFAGSVHDWLQSITFCFLVMTQQGTVPNGRCVSNMCVTFYFAFSLGYLPFVNVKKNFLNISAFFKCCISRQPHLHKFHRMYSILLRVYHVLTRQCIKLMLLFCRVFEFFLSS